jgi:FLVCR family feline leukemia virus subgroup C receptor-related protein
MLYGVYTCLGAIINNLVTAYGFSSVDASMFGAIFIVSGLVGSFVISGFLDKYNAYIKILRIVCFSSLFWGSCLRFTLPLGPKYLIVSAINIGFAGFSIIPIIPVAYSFSVELTYPVSEAMSNGSLMLASQILGVVATIVSTKLADANPNMCVYMFLTMITIGCFATFFIKEDLRRINLGKREQEAKDKRS